MDPISICLVSFAVLGVLIYSGMHVSTALFVASFGGLWWLNGNVDIVIKLLGIAATGAISSYEYGVIPLFVLMGFLVMKAGIGADTYAIAHRLMGRAPGGLGHATVLANAIFAAVTGVSIASAVLFTKLAVPEMVQRGYDKRFAVGVVAGSSMLGMLIPPSVLMVFFAILTETSIGALFMAGIVPGILLAVGFFSVIVIMALAKPGRFGAGKVLLPQAASKDESWGRLSMRAVPVLVLIGLVLGGIYSGLFTPTEAGAVGSAGALIFALLRRMLNGKALWAVLQDTSYTTASLVILIIAASMYSRFIATTGLSGELETWLKAMGFSVTALLAVYVGLILVLGAVLDSVSIMLIVVPIFSVIFKAYGVDLVWIGVITTLAIEIGLLTPPFGMAAFVIKSTINDKSVSLQDIFLGSMPFAGVAVLVTGLLIVFPSLVTGILR